MILTRNESNLEQHKKICISQKKERNKKKIAEKQIENRRYLTENSQRINNNYATCKIYRRNFTIQNSKFCIQYPNVSKVAQKTDVFFGNKAQNL